MRAAPLAAGLVVIAAAWYWRAGRDETGNSDAIDEAPAPDDPGLISQILDMWSAPPEIAPDTMSPNLRAFLAAIRSAEGTAGPNGYRTMFGGALFNDFSDHPRRAVQFTDKAGRTLWTSAAGAYQFMAVSPLPGGKFTRVNTWDRLKRKLGLVDFSPHSQDRAAIELIREAGALELVEQGAFDQAVTKVQSTWASLPGAGYSQPERTLAQLRAAYSAAGGQFA